MCFSMLASVAAGTTLVVTGAGTVKLTRRREELPLALIPLLFGVQQLIEGVVWWSLDRDSATVNGVSTCGYMLFSHVLWPVFVPFAMLCLESVSWRRKAMVACLALGAVVSLDGVNTVLRGPRASHVTGGSIQYEMPSLSVLALYVLATCGAVLLSSQALLRIMGAVALGLALLTYWLHTAVFVSVWCFFSAILTLMIFAYFASLHTPPPSTGLGRRTPNDATLARLAASGAPSAP